MNDTDNAPKGATLTITDCPALDGTFVDTLLDRVVSNVDTEWTPDHISSARIVVEALVAVMAVGAECRGAIDVETLVALMSSHVATSFGKRLDEAYREGQLEAADS